MSRVHDRGGRPDAGPVDRSEHEIAPWEQEVRALNRLLRRPPRELVTTDELRRAIEAMPPEEYESLRYYERWLRALEVLLIEKGVITREELEGPPREE